MTSLKQFQIKVRCLFLMTNDFNYIFITIVQDIQNDLSEANKELKESINDITEIATRGILRIKLHPSIYPVSDQGQMFVFNGYNDFNQIFITIVDGLGQDLKDFLMTKEMQNAVNTIECVLGR